jgi:hypothetical protein
MEKMSRKRFLQLGSAGIVGLTAMSFNSPAFALAGRTASVLDYGAEGDGVTDDSDAFRAIFSDGTVSTIQIPRLTDGSPARYLLKKVGLRGWRPLPLRTGVTVQGWGEEATILRGPTKKFTPETWLFANNDFAADYKDSKGNDNIKLYDLHVDGQRKLITETVPEGPENPGLTMLRVSSLYSKGTSGGFEMKGCQVYDWPGTVTNLVNLDTFEVSGNHIEELTGGGLVFRYRCNAGTIADNEVIRSGDDAIGYYAASQHATIPDDEMGPATNLTFRDNTCSRKRDDPFTEHLNPGIVLGIRGGDGIKVTRNHITGGLREGIYVREWRGKKCVNIDIGNNTVDNVNREAVVVLEGVTGKLHDNTATNWGQEPGFKRNGGKAYNILPSKRQMPRARNTPESYGSYDQKL